MSSDVIFVVVFLSVVFFVIGPLSFKSEFKKIRERKKREEMTKIHLFHLNEHSDE